MAAPARKPRAELLARSFRAPPADAVARRVDELIQPAHQAGRLPIANVGAQRSAIVAPAVPVDEPAEHIGGSAGVDRLPGGVDSTGEVPGPAAHVDGGTRIEQ